MKKFNTVRHESKVEKMDRQEAKKIMQKVSGNLTPKESLNENQQRIFDEFVASIDFENTPLGGVDAYEVTQAVIELSILDQCDKSIRETGTTLRNGVKNPDVATRNQSLTRFRALLDDLALTFTKRGARVFNAIENGATDELMGIIDAGGDYDSEPAI